MSLQACGCHNHQVTSLYHRIRKLVGPQLASLTSNKVRGPSHDVPRTSMYGLACLLFECDLPLS